jgi:hypothetical protein
MPDQDWQPETLNHSSDGGTEFTRGPARAPQELERTIGQRHVLGARAAKTDAACGTEDFDHDKIAPSAAIEQVEFFQDEAQLTLITEEAERASLEMDCVD